MSQKTEKMKLCEHGVIREEALLAYLNNELTAEEKQELEKLLKDDPFAQEALEGLREAKRDRSAAAVISINKKVRERTGVKETKIIKLHWTNYAWAAVIFGLLIGVGFLMVTYMSKQDNKMAMGEKPKEENIMLQKTAQPDLVPVTTGTAVTDTTTILGEAKKTTEEKLSKGVPVTGTGGKQPDNTVAFESKPRQAEMKPKTTTTQPPASGNMQTVTATGGAAAHIPTIVNSTLVADDKNTAPAKPVAKGSYGYANDANREEGTGKDNRNKNAETGKTNSKTEKKKEPQLTATQDMAPATETTIMRGAVMEKEPANKVTVITMEDAMKNFNSGDYKTSSEQFSEILKQQPANADALYFGGISDYINGNEKKSEKNFDKLLKEGTKFTEGSKWYKANILLKKGKKEEAKKILDELANSGGSYKERAVKKKAEVEF